MTSGDYTRVLCGACGDIFHVGRAVPGRRRLCPHCLKSGIYTPNEPSVDEVGYDGYITVDKNGSD